MARVRIDIRRRLHRSMSIMYAHGEYLKRFEARKKSPRGKEVGGKQTTVVVWRRFAILVHIYPVEALIINICSIWTICEGI